MIPLFYCKFWKVLIWRSREGLIFRSWIWVNFNYSHMDTGNTWPRYRTPWGRSNNIILVTHLVSHSINLKVNRATSLVPMGSVEYVSMKVGGAEEAVDCCGGHEMPSTWSSVDCSVLTRAFQFDLCILFTLRHFVLLHMGFLVLCTISSHGIYPSSKPRRFSDRKPMPGVIYQNGPTKLIFCKEKGKQGRQEVIYQASHDVPVGCSAWNQRDNDGKWVTQNVKDHLDPNEKKNFHEFKMFLPLWQYVIQGAWSMFLQKLDISHSTTT